jgi:hypothetical protein
LQSQYFFSDVELKLTNSGMDLRDFGNEFAQGYWRRAASKFWGWGGRSSQNAKANVARMIQTLTQQRNDDARIIIDCFQMQAPK